MKGVFTLGFLLIALGGCKGGTSIWLTPPPHTTGPTSPPPASAEQGLKVVANDPALLDGPGQETFKIGTVRELLVRLTLPAAPANLMFVTLSMIDPHGSVFSTRSVAFSTDPSVKQTPAPGATGVMMDVDPVKTLAKGVALDSYFLVGGTALQNKGSGGVWKIRAEVDGHPTASAEKSVDFGMTL